jgi:hypothetical protein
MLVFAAVAAVSAGWLVRDRAPLVFDQLSHLQSSLFFDSFPRDYLTEERQFYPPAVHVVFTTLLRLTGYRFDAAIGALGIGSLAVVMWATYGIGAELWSRRAGAYAAALIALYPAVYVHSRSLLLDLPLTAVVAVSLLALLRSRALTEPRWSAVFGLACAVGLLTKQMFLAAIIPPLAFELLRRRGQHGSLACIALAFVPPLVVLGAWYAPRLGWFFGDYREQQEAYARARGDPSTWSVLGLTYYLRGTWHETTFELAALWVVALPLFLRMRKRGFVLCWWAGVFAVSTVLVLKDSRFLMPALPAIALMTAAGLSRLRQGAVVMAVVCAFGLIQLWAASFGAGWLPRGDPVTNLVMRDEGIELFSQNWSLNAEDSSIADASGWGGTAAGLHRLRGARIAIVGDRVLYMAARNPDIAPVANDIENLTCADTPRFASFDIVVVQVGGRAGVDQSALAACIGRPSPDERIPLDAPRLLPGAVALAVFHLRAAALPAPTPGG